MSLVRYLSPDTTRYSDGLLVTRAHPKFSLFRVSRNGRVHVLERVIVRWDTFAEPVVLFMPECGARRTSEIRPVQTPVPEAERCRACAKRCDTVCWEYE